MKDFIIKKLPLLTAVILLIFAVAISGLTKQNKTEIKTLKTAGAAVSDKEIRGLWVTYMDLNMSGTDRSYTAFKDKFNHIADTAKADKFNTLIVQVTPFSDALYNSSVYPASHVLSGKQGKSCGYDALSYMTEYARKIGMRIEAWVNPYRIRNDKSLKLSADNPYKKDKSIGKSFNNGLFLNPASSKARKIIESGVREIVKNYDVDGIQFDDYFYPSGVNNSFDKDEYSAYKNSVGSDKALSLANWRTANVNVLIADCCTIAHKYGKTFGISPQGNLDNNYHLYADVKSWCQNSGYIDYICPQLYFSLKNPALKFEDALKSWLDLDFAEDVKLYIGIAGYKTGTDLDSGTWNGSDTILKNELKLIRKSKIKGFMLYSYADLESDRASKEIVNLVNGIEN